MKWNQAAKAISGDVVTFVDDLRASGNSVEHSWQVSHQSGSRLQYLGIQDAHVKGALLLKRQALGLGESSRRPTAESPNLSLLKNGSEVKP
jgi:hypothetical protein